MNNGGLKFRPLFYFPSAVYLHYYKYLAIFEHINQKPIAMKRPYITLTLLAALAAISTTSCGRHTDPAVTGSADGPTQITVTDDTKAKEGIIGSADGPTAIYVTDKDKDNIDNPAAMESLLAAKGRQLIGQMGQLARSKEYILMMTSSQPIQNEISLISAADYTTPKEIFIIDGKSFETDTLDFVHKHIVERAIRSAAAMINGLNGTQPLSATSILQVDDTLLCPMLKHTIIMLFAYDAPYSALVTYRPAEDGTVAAVASFVKFPASGTASVSHYVAEVIGSAIGSEEITVRSIDIP